MSIPKRNSKHETEKHGIEPELKDINPGLFSMKLNLMYIDHVQIEHKKISLLAAKQEEHQVVHAVIDLMLTLLENPLQNRRRIAHNIEKLQQNIKTNPKHLNTLADLAILYRTINTEDKAVAIYETIDRILISNDPIDIKEKAVCVLEQGYAVLCDEFSQNGFEAQHELADSFQYMQLEKSASVGRKHDLLCQASQHTMIAQQLLNRAMNCKTNDDACYEKKSSMMLFEKGIFHLENTAYSKENIYIWKYYYARACNSVTLISSTNDIKACELYLSVLENLPKENKRYAVYRARAYACIGHRLVTPKEVRNADLKKSSLSNDELFQVLMKYPLSAFSYANAEHTDDAIVLNRKGKSLLFVSFDVGKFGSEHAKTTEHQKQKHLTEAIEALSLSLSLNPRLDHLNFSLRMNVYFDMSNLKHIYNGSRYDLLQKALEDGKAALHVNLKGKDVCKVAEICQRLAKFPKYFFYGPKSVTNKEYLHIALDYLNQYICTKGQPYTLAFAIGTIHFDMGKFRSALEWHKRAFLLSDYKRATSTCSNVRKLCLCILRLEEATTVHIEFIHALTFIARKLDKLEFVDTLVPNNLWNEYFGKFLRFLDFLNTFPLTQKQVGIADRLKNVLLDKTRISATQLRKYQFRPSTRNMEDKWTTSKFSHLVSEPASDHLDFEYDYFAIMSHENSGWIECFLVQQLNTQMLYNDRTFTACSEVINYDSCSTLLETTINGINKSQKVILVLSNDFLTKEWNVLKSLITETLQRRQGIILVILLEHCDVPPEIDSEHLMYFDFSDEKNIPMEIQNLKLALVSV